MLEIDSMVAILFQERITFNSYLIVKYTIYNHVYTTSYSITTYLEPSYAVQVLLESPKPTIGLRSHH